MCHVMRLKVKKSLSEGGKYMDSYTSIVATWRNVMRTLRGNLFKEYFYLKNNPSCGKKRCKSNKENKQNTLKEIPWQTIRKKKLLKFENGCRLIFLDVSLTLQDNIISVVMSQLHSVGLTSVLKLMSFIISIYIYVCSPCKC